MPPLEEFKARLDAVWSQLGEWKVPMARSGTTSALRSIPTRIPESFHDFMADVSVGLPWQHHRQGNFHHPCRTFQPVPDFV